MHRLFEGHCVLVLVRWEVCKPNQCAVSDVSRAVKKIRSVEVLFVLGPSQGSAPGGPGRTKQSGLGLDAAGAEVPAEASLIVLVSEEQEERLAYARAFADLQVAIAPLDEPP